MTQFLAMLSFVAPWMALGAVAALGLPLLAHLLSKTRYKEVAFPAARLVQQAVAATSRIETPRHRLLMLLRWLLLLLVVMAFMRPQWQPQAEAVSRDEGVALVVLIDASASMRRTVDGATLYDRAIREAQTLIDALDPSRDVAAVIRVDRAPMSLLPEVTGQLGLLTERVEDSEPGYTTANWAGALAAADRLTQNTPRGLRLVTLSDQQGEAPAMSETDWPGLAQRLHHIRIDGPNDNTAIRLLDVRPYPAIAGQPVTATAEVRHFGSRRTNATLTAQLDTQETKRSISLAPGAAQRIDIRLPQVVGKRADLRVTLDAKDAIAADNIAGASLPVQSRTRALVVHDTTAASQALASRLSTLLNPGEVEGAALPTVESHSIDTASEVLQDADTAMLRTVVLINQAPLPEAVSEALEAYAQAGGGVVRFVAEARSSQQATTAAGIDFEIEPLRVFEGPARAGLAGLQWPGVDNSPIDERAQPILTDADGRVIVAAMPRGRGRLIAINATLAPGPGGLLAEPAFVVLFNELCRYASRGSALPDPARPGDPLPSALLNAAQAATPDNADPDAEVFTASGAYAAIDANGGVIEVHWAQLDPSESDTRLQPAWPVTNGQTDAGSVDLAVTSASAELAASIRPKPIELWPSLVLAALVLVAAESLLLWRFAGPRATALQGGAV